MKKLFISAMLIPLVYFATPLSTQAQTSVKSELSEQVRGQILSLNQEMEQAFEATDPYKIGEYYDNDAVIYYNGNKISGRKELSQFWLGIANRKAFKMEVEELNGNGKYIYQTGNVVFTTDQTCEKKSFLMVLKRLPDFEYKVVAMAFN